MSETVLNATTGRATGSSSARRLRSEGRVPGVVYGLGMDPLSISVDRRELRAAVSGSAGLNTILDLTIDGEMYPSIIKDVQRHPVRLNIEHLDFIQVDLNAQIIVNVPIRLTGTAKEVNDNSGLIDQIMSDLEVSTTPRNIPDEIVVDVSDMDMDSTITVADLTLPAGVVATADPESAVVTVSIMRTPVLDEEAAEAEAAAAEAAEGEARRGWRRRRRRRRRRRASEPTERTARSDARCASDRAVFGPVSADGAVRPRGQRCTVRLARRRARESGREVRRTPATTSARTRSVSSPNAATSTSRAGATTRCWPRRAFPAPAEPTSAPRWRSPSPT